MRKPDINFTRRLQEWLNTPKDERDIKAGAEMMLQLNRNRALYNSVMARPDRFHSKLEYELRKFLRIRLDNMTLDEVTALEDKVLPAAEEIVENPPLISTDDELPERERAVGRRKDHDSLPPRIKALFDDNFEVYKTVKHLFEECKAMNGLKPCDRYDKVQQLAAAESRYRKNLNEYDAYDAASAAPEPHELTEEEKAEAELTAKRINAARKSLSTYKKVAEESGGDDALRTTAIGKMQLAVNTLVECNANFSDDYKAELTALGIEFGEAAVTNA